MTSTLSPRSLLRQPRPLPVFDRVLLIIPSSIFLLDERVFQSLGILKVAAVLERAGIAVEVLDLNGISNYLEAAEAHFTSTKARAIGITATTPQLPAVAKLVQIARHVIPDARLILGGPHATLTHVADKLEKKQGRVGRAHRALSRLETMFDVLVSGDGEDAIFVALGENPPKIIDADDPKNGMFMSDAAYESSPLPARHLIDMDSYNYLIDGQRAISVINQLGCPFRCSFCAGRSSNMLRRIRTRSTESVIAEYEHLYRTYGNTGYMCYDESTEILTTRGFVYLSEIQPSDAVAVLDPTTDELHFEVPRRRIHKRFDGKLITVRSKSVDLAVTPEHRMWLRMKRSYGRHSQTSEYLHMRADEMIRTTRYIEMHQRAKWRGQHFSHFSIPAYRVVYLGRGRGSPKIQSGMRMFPAKLWVRFMAWYLSEGSCYRPRIYLHGKPRGRGNRICIKQYKKVNPTHVKEIGEIISALGYRWSYSSNQFHIDSKELYMYLHQFGDAHHKHVPPEFKEMSDDLIRLFIQTYIKGDGHRTPRGQETITSHSERMRDDLQELAIKCGYWASLDHHHRVLLRPQGDFVVNDARRLKMKKPFGQRAYHGNVHCVTVSTGLILVRRNGKAVWCGNCHDDELNVNKEVVPLMNEIAALGTRLGIEWRLRGFIKAELFTEEQAEAMYRAGFRWLLCGFEAAHPRILENIEKIATLEDNTRVVEVCHKYGLKIKALMSVGHAGESEVSIRAVHDWLLEVKPDDFDCTIITAYPGSPYYDRALPHETLPDVWTFTAKKSGDRLHSYDLDYTQVADYYKGDPEGGYKSYVFTDHLSPERIVELRDWVERDVRQRLSIPFNTSAAARRYEHSMGQSELPPFILRSSKPSK